MDEQNQIKKARHQWRVRMVLVMVGLAAILALSLWIRTGHNTLLADSVAVIVVIAVAFSTWRTNDARAANDPSFAKGYNPSAQVTMPIRFIGSRSSFVLIAILLTLPVEWGLAAAVRWVPPLRHLLVGATTNQILVLSFAVSVAIAGGFVLLARRLWNGSRSSRPENSEIPQRD